MGANTRPIPTKTPRSRAVLIAALLAGIAGCGKTTGERERARAAEERARDQEEQRVQLAKLLAERDADQAKVAALLTRREEETAATRAAEAELAAATTAAARDAARVKVSRGQAQLKQTAAELEVLRQRAIHPDFPPRPPGPAGLPCTCVAGDPLCSCL
jgi:Tfp pilus assembly protein FimV